MDKTYSYGIDLTLDYSVDLWVKFFPRDLNSGPCIYISSQSILLNLEIQIYPAYR